MFTSALTDEGQCYISVYITSSSFALAWLQLSSLVSLMMQGLFNGRSVLETFGTRNFLTSNIPLEVKGSFRILNHMDLKNQK